MAVKRFRKGLPEDFDNDVAVPKTDNQRNSWQDLNKSWWQSNPMRYDEITEHSHEEFSKGFYEEIDQRFFSSVWNIMPWETRPFDNLIDFKELKNKDVLEIGVGCGSHAQLISSHCKSYTGIDLTDYAIKCTKNRLALSNSPGQILQMDAEKLQFDDNSFDFIWSWGVIHHSSNTKVILKEINRVLRKNGKVITMVYHRSPWNHLIRGGLYYGIIKGGFLKGKSITRLMQENTDGAIARYYTIPEWEAELSPYFKTEKNLILGSKSQLIPLPYGATKEFIMKLIPSYVGRFITNRPSVGFELVSVFSKK